MAHLYLHDSLHDLDRDPEGCLYLVKWKTVKDEEDGPLDLLEPHLFPAPGFEAYSRQIAYREYLVSRIQFDHVLWETTCDLREAMRFQIKGNLANHLIERAWEEFLVYFPRLGRIIDEYVGDKYIFTISIPPLRNEFTIKLTVNAAKENSDA